MTFQIIETFCSSRLSLSTLFQSFFNFFFSIRFQFTKKIFSTIKTKLFFKAVNPPLYSGPMWNRLKAPDYLVSLKCLMTLIIRTLQYRAKTLFRYHYEFKSAIQRISIEWVRNLVGMQECAKSWSTRWRKRILESGGQKFDEKTQKINLNLFVPLAWN